MTGNTSPTINNIFRNIPESSPSSEIIDSLLDLDNCKIERIISSGQASPEDFWYDQMMNEWLILLSGSAEIEFIKPSKFFSLKKGDFLFIPAHQLHRVTKTDQNRKTLWLAFFFDNNGQ